MIKFITVLVFSHFSISRSRKNARKLGHNDSSTKKRKHILVVSSVSSVPSVSSSSSFFLSFLIFPYFSISRSRKNTRKLGHNHFVVSSVSSSRLFSSSFFSWSRRRLYAWWKNWLVFRWMRERHRSFRLHFVFVSLSFLSSRISLSRQSRSKVVLARTSNSFCYRLTFSSTLSRLMIPTLKRCSTVIQRLTVQMPRVQNST